MLQKTKLLNQRDTCILCDRFRLKYTLRERERQRSDKGKWESREGNRGLKILRSSIFLITGRRKLFLIFLHKFRRHRNYSHMNHCISIRQKSSCYETAWNDCLCTTWIASKSSKCRTYLCISLPKIHTDFKFNRKGSWVRIQWRQYVMFQRQNFP